MTAVSSAERAGALRLRQWRAHPPDRAFLLALAAVLPLFTWWLGWFPGFASSDSIDQLGQVRDFDFTNVHPALHSILMWVVTRVWDSPGAVTLVQVLAMTGLLALAARRLVQLGVPVWLSAGAAWLVAALPAVGTTTIALWKDVPFTLAMLWAFTELLLMARDPGGFWRQRGGPIRLGVALGLMWMFRHNGFITVGLLLMLLGVAFRRKLRPLLKTAAAVAVVVIAVDGLLYTALGVDRAAIEPSQVFISDVAASLTHEPGNFDAGELEYLAAVAPLDVWTGRYDCTNSTPLAFAPEFDAERIAADPWPFRRLAVKTWLRDADTVLGHRFCAASYLFWPIQPGNAYFHRPPFEIAANDLGITRDPVSYRAYDFTLSIFQWAEPDGRLWLTWRPALVLWAAAAVYAFAASRARWRLLMPAALLAAHLVNVAVTTPAQEFRFAFGLYVAGILSLPLLWLVLRPEQESQASHPLPGTVTA